MRGSYLNDPCRELRTGEPDSDWPERGPVAARQGGPARCPRPCSECSGEHHFSDAMIDFAGDDSDADGMSEEQPHEAEIAGCEAWYLCKHCPAWREYLDDEDDPGPEEHDLDEEGPGRYSTGGAS